MSLQGLRARLEATPGSGPSIGLAFLLTADVAGEVALWVPVIPRLRAFIDGVEVPIARPPLDVPAAVKRYAVGPGLTTRVPCPVLLLFGMDGAEGDGMDWTLRHAPPATVDLEAAIPLDHGLIEAPRVTVAL